MSTYADRTKRGTVPESGEEGSVLAEREWGLSAGQVAAVVVAIIALCQVIGALS